MTTILSSNPVTSQQNNGSGIVSFLRNCVAKFMFTLVATFIFAFGVLAQTTTFNYSGTIVNYTVPAGVSSITIVSKGAQGGGSIGGLGASMTGTFAVTPGQVLKVLVGGQGGDIGTGRTGGGGGSFVTDALNNPLIVAGGGGGIGNCGNVAGLPGVITTAGTNPNPAQPQNGGGGINGGGGGGAVQGSGAGGGGLLGNGGKGLAGNYCGVGGAGGNGTNGADGTCGGGQFANGGQSFINGGAGGSGGSGTVIAGGFGGGGAAVSWNCGGGGGGGYSGGGGGAYDGQHRPGGGGGSYNGGTAQTNISGNNSGNGAVTITANFTPATALKFDPSLTPGDNSRLNYVSVSNPYTAFQKEITVEFWMFVPNANLPFGSVMGQSNNNGGDNNNSGEVWLMHPNTNGTMTFYVNDGGTLRATNCTINANSWHHYAGVANATSTKFYVDGILVHTGPGISGTISVNPSSVIHIGKDVRFATRYAPQGDPQNRYATMTLDEVRIWSRALCSDEINTNKNAEINPAGQNGLQEYYRFNQGSVGANNTSVTSVTDLSGNNRNGVLNNFTLTGAASNWVASGSTLSGIVNAFVAPTAPITGTTTVCLYSSPTLSNANFNGVWSSSNSSVASINATTGLVSANAAGTATITYTTVCGGVSTTLFTVLPDNTLSLSSGAGSNAQVICQNSPITPITYNIAGTTAAAISFSPLAGLTTAIAGNTITISGTPTVTTTYNLQTSGGCGTAYASGSVTVKENNTIAISSGVGTNAQSVCLNSPISNITYTTTGATGATVSGLPTGVTGVWSGNVVTISGTPAIAGTFTYTINLTGGCGNTTASGTITVKNTPVVTIAAIGGTNTCPGGFVALTANAPAGSTYQWRKDGVPVPGATNTSYMATAAGSYTVVVINNGCTSAASNAVAITVTDVTAPTITCPSNQILNLDASCNAILPDYRSLLTATDNCTASNALVITQSPSAGTAVNAKGALIITFTVTDASNNSSTCTITVDKKDVTAPVITCRAPITVNNTTNTCGAVVTFINPTATDNCSGSAFSFWNAGEPNNAGGEDYLQLYNSATWNDLPNYVLNKSIVEFNSIISTTFANYTLIGTFGGHTYYVSNGTASWTNSRTAAQGIGADLASINTLAESQFLAPYGGATWVGGYQDTADPAYAEPGNASQNYGGWKWVDGTKLGSGQITITQIAGLSSGSVFPVGVTTNTFRATDESGNSSTCSFTVTVTDNQSPTIVCPANQTVNATSAAGAVVNYVAPIGTDNCPGATTIRTAGLASGSTFPIGTTTVSYRVTDAAGLVTNCSFTVTVVGALPVIVTPSNITVANTPGLCSAVVNFSATDATGIPASTITYSIAPGSVFPVGTTTVTATATNAIGSSSGSFTVTVTALDTDGDGISDACDADADNDGIPNSLECNQSNFFWSSPPTVSTSNVNTATGTINGIAYTYTSTSPVSTTSSMYGHNQFPLSYGVPNVNPTIQNLAITNNTITFASPMTNPVLVFASIGNTGLPVPISFGAPVEIVWSKDVTVNSPTSITGREGYAIVRMMGTFSSISFNYQTAENWCNFAFGADFQNCGDTDNDGTPNYLDTDSDGDGCPDAIEGSLSLSMSNVSNGRLTGGVNSQGIPLLAGNGQTIGTSQNNVVNCFCQPGLDETPPTVITKNITVNLNASGNATITAAQVNNGSTDNCAIASITVSKTSFNCSNLGANTVTLTVTDTDGNVGTATATVTVVDAIAPTVVCPANQTLNLDASCNATLPDYRSLLTVNDNCTAGNALVITQSPAAGTVVNSKGALIVTFTVTDASNNSSNCTITVDKLDVIAPVIACPAPISVNNSANTCGAVVNYINPTATDNCSGGAFNFFNPGEPNNYFGTSNPEDYLQLYTNGTWNDYVQATALNSIVEFNTVISTVFPNYNLIGTYGGHTYYFSTLTNGWLNSRAAAQAIGGDLASINTLGESQFLAPYGGNTWVGGYQDHSDPAYVEPGNASQNYGGWKWVDGTKLGAGQINITQIAGLPSGSVFPVGVTTNTFRATDESGNTSTCSFTVTVRDAQPPVITCPANITVNATSAAGAVVTYAAPVGTDNCPGATTLRTAGPASGSVFPLGTTTITHTVTDGAGLTASCSFTVTVNGVPPVIVCPANITRNNDPGQCGAVVNYAATETTGIPASTITYSIPSGSFFNVGETTVTATATNAIGTSTCTFTVRVNDTQAPTVITQNVTVYLDNNGQASITAAQVNNGSSDNCGIATVTVSPNTFTCANVSSLVNISSQTIVSDNTWTESTTSYSTGNYCTTGVWNGVASPMPALASYTIVPTINAYSIAPIAGTQGLYGLSGVRFFRKTFTLNTLTDIKATLQVAMDNGVQIFINGVAVATKGIMANTFNGANPVTAVLHSTGSNVNGGVGGQSFDNITNTNAAGLFVVGTNEIVLALANCDGGDRGAISFKATIETNNGGPSPVVLTVTDVNGNTATATAQVTVVDAIDPVLTCQDNIEVFATSASGATVNYVAPTATDNCSAAVTRTAGLASGATFPIGTTTVTHTATDPSGNSVTCSFTVTVTGLPPVIFCPADIAVTSTAGQCGTNVTFAATETTAIPASTIVYTENGNVVTSGSFFSVGTHTITATATNPVGSVSCTFTITVTDVETPVIITPANIAVNNDAGVCGAQISIAPPAATDNCGIASVIGTRTDGLLVTAVYPVGVTGILWTATDVNGLTASHTQLVTVTDNEAPVVITNNITIQLDASGNASITPAQINNGSTDNCGIATISLDKTTFNCSNVGANTVTLTVTDIHGNPSVQQATVTVQDITPAIVFVQDITVPLNAAGTASIMAADINNGSTDACGIQSMTISQSSFTCANIGANNVVLTVTDVNGNVSSATAIVTIADLIAPTVITNNITIQLDANGNASITPAQINNGSTDNCTIASYSLDKTTFNCANVGANTVILTVTDVNGNSSSQTAIVTIVDQIAPIVLTNNMVIALDASGAASITTAQINNNSSDNCGIATISLDKTTFNCSNVGNNTVILTVTDVNGNVNTATATVTVIDNLAPIVTVPASQVFCANANGSTQYTIPAASATDNCSIATVTYAVTGATGRTGTGYDASGTFNIGTSTITWTVTDVNGNTSTSSITVVVNPLPVATYVSSNADAFCNQTSLTASSSINPALYSWSASNAPATFTGNPVLSLGLTNADGNYYLYTQSSVTGCVSATAAVYNFQKQSLSSSYTILAYKEVELGKYNKVLSGSVGVMTSKGEAEFKSYSGVTGAGSFVKAPKIDKDGYGITLNSQLIGIAAVTLPTMQYNTSSTNNLPSYTASQNNATLTGNYKNLTIKRGISVTVTGSTFGNIRLEEGASIRFTSTVLNIENFTADKGYKNRDYTYIRFAPNTSVRVANKVSIGSQVLLNPESYKVSFYMADNRKDEEKFTVKGGDTRVIANVLMPNGKLRVTATDSDKDDDDDHGGNNHGDCNHQSHSSKDCKHRGHEHNDCDHRGHAASSCQDDVYMTGLFIAEKVESKGNKVIWNSYDCSAPTAPITSVNNAGVTQSVSAEKAELVVKSEEELKVTVMPNPSTTYFTLKLESKYETPVNLRVMDGAGRVVDARSKLGSNSTFQIGHNYSSGTYYAELIQGTKRKVVLLIKARG